MDRRLKEVSLLGLVLPYALQLPGLVLYGSDWLSPYFDAWAGVALALNALPVATLVLLRTSFPQCPRAFRWATWFAYGFLACAHLFVYLGSSEWDRVLLLVFPLWAILAAIVGWRMIRKVIGPPTRSPRFIHKRTSISFIF